MLRSILAVIAAVFTWFVAASLGNWVIRAVLPGYSAAEPTMAFTLPMMLCRLALGLVASLCAGFVCGLITNRKNAARVAAAIMVILFIPVHYMLWAKFPVWYHLFFLVTLAPALLVGAVLPGRSLRANV